MLAQVGLDASLNLMPRAQYFPKLWERDSTMFLMGFNSPYFDGLYVLETMLMSRNDDAGDGIYNYAQNSDKALDQAISDARAILDSDERHRKMQAVFRSIKEDMLYVPLHHQVLVYAMQNNVTVQIRPDNLLEIRWVTLD